MSKEVKLIADSIVYAVQNERPNVVAVLLKNGVIVPSGTSDAKLIILVSDVFKKSKPFRKNFLDLISKTEYVSTTSESFSNAFGDYAVADINFGVKPKTTLTGASSLTNDSILNSVPTVASTKNYSSTPSTSFWTTNNIMSLLNKASDVYTTSSTNKANIALAEAAKARAEAGFETPEVGSYSNGKSNTGMYVLLAIVGIASVGGLVWYLSKNKK